MKLFEYVILYVPKKDSKESPKVLTKGIETAVAQDVKHVEILASRQIPEEYLSKLDEVQVAVRPF